MNSKTAFGTEVSEGIIRKIVHEELTNITSKNASEFDSITQPKRNLKNQLKDAIHIELNKDNNTKSDYKHNLSVKFEHFYKFFISDTRINELFCVIDDKIYEPKGLTEQLKEKHRF